MNLSEPFIRRPVGTTLLTIAIFLAGVLGYQLLPVSSLPNIDFPSISVSAALPGANPETMASAVATPLERQFGRIAGVTEMSSTSQFGSTSVSMQFELGRDSDAAARDVQAAINAARGQLPTNLPNNPSYRKVNPADAPIMLIALTSDYYTRAEMYDYASTILAQRLAQVQGVGQVFVGGGSNAGVRVDVNPTALNHYGLSLEDLRTALNAANANRPKGQISNSQQTWSISATDQLLSARDYEPLIIAYRNQAPLRLSDVATVTDDMEDLRAYGMHNGRAAITLVIFRQTGANIIRTVDQINAMLPQLKTQVPAGIDMNVIMDRTTTIRASLADTQWTLMLSVVLVILVVFVFLRDLRTTLIPSVAVPVSLVGTFGVMYLLDYSIDNLSLMALTIATGFVVDDAIVVIENISRYLEKGWTPFRAAMQGASEIGFTVLSMSVSLVAVFIPILLMSGFVGRLFREFAVTLSVAIGISLIVSLTTTPMMCAMMLKHRPEHRPGWLSRFADACLDYVIQTYAVTLGFVLRHQRLMMLVTLSTVGLTVWLYFKVPKGFFPQQDTGRLNGNLVADQDTSFPAMQQIMAQFTAVVSEDPAVAHVAAYAGGTGGGGSPSNSARMFITLKPLAERGLRADQIVTRIDKKTEHLAGATLFLQAVQDLRMTARNSSTQFQYTLRGENLDELSQFATKMLQEMRKIDGLGRLDSDLRSRGLQSRLEIDRAAAARHGISISEIDNTLYDAFGQRQVSTIYKDQNQYHVVMEVESDFAKNPDALRHVYIRGAGGVQVPLSALAQPATRNVPLAVPHSGQFPSITLSFNLLPGTSLSEVLPKIEETARKLEMPKGITGRFSGAAQAFQDSLSTQPLLILAALIAVYLVLGILYESYIHPLTILSTIPSAGVGALLALLLCRVELNVMSMIGILLLIGIVKKNAILMIDFALEAERKEGKTPEDAIFEACLLRFRPITMTTLAALLGALPLAFGTGVGAELRQPLGIAIVGGLIFSQMLTLYTTPVVYLYLDRWTNANRRKAHAA